MVKYVEHSLVLLDLNNSIFQDNLLNLQKPEQYSVLKTLKKLNSMTWEQIYRDNGLKWEKITSIKPFHGVEAVYSLRITQSMRATAYRSNNYMCFLTLSPDHDATYGKK